MEDRISQIFSAFLERNVMVTVVILAVLLVRFLIRRCPKKYSYLLWGIVGIRMLFDLPFASSLSLFNLFQVKMNSVPLAEQVTQIPSGETVPVHETVNTNTNPVMTGVDVPLVNPVTSGETKSTILTVFAVIWLVGIVLLLAYGIFSYVKCRRLVKTAVRLEPVEVQSGGPHGHRRFRKGTDVWECDGIPSPFVLGIFRPRIYIPFHMEPQERTYILAHEQTHIRRCDHLIKLVAYLLLCVYWWNPLVWLAFYYMVRDMEMSCDEAVLEIFGDSIKKEYSSSLLSFAMERSTYTFAPLAFGEGDAGKRIKNVLNFKKPHTWVAILVVVLIVVFAVSCLTNQKSDREDVSEESGQQLQPEIQQSSQEMVVDNAIEAEIEQSIVEWAQAFCDRDGLKIMEMTTEEAQASLIEEQLLRVGEMDGETYVDFGSSSPWPGDHGTGLPAYGLYSVDKENQTAEILYYAVVSDPHVTVWKEIIHYATEEGRFQVTQEEMQYYDNITSGHDYDIAYSQGINQTMMDYTINGCGDFLSELATRGGGYAPDGFFRLYDVMDAVHCLLNLPCDETKILMDVMEEEYKPNREGGRVVIRISFLEDGKQRMIEMIQPWGEEGIWIPQDYKDNESASIQEQDMLVSSIKNRWYDTHFYPIYPGNEEWQKHDMEETLDLMNPPLDLLLSMPSEELADLMQNYPCLNQITTYYREGSQDYVSMFTFLETHSNIFCELLRREDGILCLLKAYQNSGLDAAWFEDDNIDESNENMQKWYAEIFGSQFIQHYANRFTKEECVLANQIIEEKKKVYNQVGDAIRYYFDLSPIQSVEGSDIHASL